VTVRFGRLGATGQTQTKTFGSVAEAEAHRAKLVAEKSKKGYKPIGSVSLVPPAAPVETAPVDVDERAHTSSSAATRR